MEFFDKREKILLIVSECGILAVSWKHVTLISRILCVVLCSLEGSLPLEPQISHSPLQSLVLYCLILIIQVL